MSNYISFNDTIHDNQTDSGKKSLEDTNLIDYGNDITILYQDYGFTVTNSKKISLLPIDLTLPSICWQCYATVGYTLKEEHDIICLTLSTLRQLLLPLTFLAFLYATISLHSHSFTGTTLHGVFHQGKHRKFCKNLDKHREFYKSYFNH